MWKFQPPVPVHYIEHIKNYFIKNKNVGAILPLQHITMLKLFTDTWV